MAAPMETATMEIEEIHEDALEEWLCGAIGLSLRRALPRDDAELMPVPPQGSRPGSAFSCRSRTAFRDNMTEVSLALDAIADDVFGEIAAPRVPAASRRGTAATFRNARYVSSNSAADIVCREAAEPEQLLVPGARAAERHSGNSTAADVAPLAVAAPRQPMVPSPPAIPRPEATRFRLYRGGSGGSLAAVADPDAMLSES